ncbi:extracellular solute-binding protein [Paenibacillus sp. IHBB 10380]|uniref:extracellular solute-binding protein n=1 Tax=Paenibacillus sp. IHBB 10380 TaxID=1566358 RepID=UPI0005CFD246|nr:extracellular solute-binding protein [Paenibacillus sp. IHBB 10380]AJS61212.1 sugar ABC transporter substrate-binding protein [Paenibacillus sp. IHBB 10380]
MKKKLAMLLIFTVAISMLAACGSKSTDNKGTAEGVTAIEFWTANNPPQQAYWESLAKEYETVNPKIKINVSPMKETPSSEANIQSAIAGGSAPTLSENISRGFAAQLTNSKALVPLNTMAGWDDIVAGRNMTNTIESWKFSDDNQYVLPISSNAMLFGWRLDILKELGYNEPPKTYSEMLDVAKKLKVKYPDKYVWAKADLADPAAWKRWFDFFMLYNAASDGNKFIEGGKFVADDKAGIATLGLMDNLRKEKSLLAENITDPFETGVGIFTDIGPWTLNYWAEKFPELKYNETYTLAAPPVPDDVKVDHPKTFADTKGIVIYASAPKEKQEAAMEFMKWVYSDAKHDLQWFEKTNMPPARDDLSTNDVFKAFLDENPALKKYAEAVPYAVPPMDNAKFNELQTFIGQEAVNPVVRGQIDPTTGWNNMKKAIEEALK